MAVKHITKKRLTKRHQKKTRKNQRGGVPMEYVAPRQWAESQAPVESVQKNPEPKAKWWQRGPFKPQPQQQAPAPVHVPKRMSSKPFKPSIRGW